MELFGWEVTDMDCINGVLINLARNILKYIQLWMDSPTMQLKVLWKTVEDCFGLLQTKECHTSIRIPASLPIILPKTGFSVHNSIGTQLSGHVKVSFIWAQKKVSLPFMERITP